MINLNIFDTINSDEADTPEQGDIIFKLITDTHNSTPNEHITLDFSDINSFTSAFINHAIGKLFNSFSIEELLKFLHITGLKNNDDVNILQISIRNAINHYSKNN